MLAMLAVRLVCLGYLLLLTVLLLVPDPLALLGIRVIPGTGGGPGTHFLLFTLLAVMVMACRLAWRKTVLAALLVTHALTAELLQSLVPMRSVQLGDLIENLLGLAAGTIIYQKAFRLLRKAPSKTGSEFWRPDLHQLWQGLRCQAARKGGFRIRT